ncbi:Basic 7S globulin [Bienertia sinuspersici]
MTSSFYHHLFIFSLLISTTFAATNTRPKALVFPVSKDSTTLQYIVPITQRTPPKRVPTTLHLGGPLVWVDCDRGYVSSTYCPARCNSAPCTLANSISCGSCNAPPGPGCNNNTCGLSPQNPITNIATSGELASDVVRVNSTTGLNPGPIVKATNFLFSCGPTFLLKGLAKGVQGVIGLGRTKISPVFQLSSTFSFPKKFAVCLSSSSSNGVIFFGDAPFQFYPPTDLNSLKYTPLITNPTTPTEYFIGVTSIKVDNTTVPINKSLLFINKKGNGGTKLSTIIPYTLIETSIFKALTTSFDKRLKQQFPEAKRVNGVAPFDVCYDSNTLTSTRVGVVVPDIQLVLQNNNVVWTIYASNSIVTIDANVRCLALVDSGMNPKTSIVLGGYQLEDNFMQFDLAKSRLGFNYLVFRTRCSNFNFTSVA